MRLIKIFFHLVVLTFVIIQAFGGCGSLVFAQSSSNSQKAVSIVNPIRGTDFWTNKYSVLETPKAQYELIKKNHLNATWLVRFDAIQNKEAESFLKSLDSSQEVGLFLEVTPSLTKAANVNYNQSSNWHKASSVLLTGYSPEDRKKMIDTSFKRYNEIFGKDPKSVGAWWIDAGSLSYMKEKYGIIANLDVADQFSTDQYQVWGQYWSSPFYPSKVNALMPARSTEQKIGVVTTQWAPRDPFNGFGIGVFESTFSVQANDYILHDLDHNYFKKLLNIYPMITVGLENDFSWSKFGPLYEKQMEVLIEGQKSKKLQIRTMQDFATFYIAQNPDISPNVLIIADDPLGSAGKVVWINTPKYRFGWFYTTQGSIIRDLRDLNDSIEESCLKKACSSLNLAFAPNQAVDDVNFSSKWILDEGKISDFKITKSRDTVEFSYKNQAGILRSVKLFPNDIQIDNKTQPISTAIMNITTQGLTKPTKITPEFTPEFDWGKNIPAVLINFLKFLSLSILFFVLPGYVLSRNWILSIPLGWSTFTLFSFILGYLKADFLIWILPIVSAMLLFKLELPKISFPKLTKLKLLTLVLITVGSFTWLLTNIKNGLLYNFGYGYWGPNGHDAIWHLSLISELQRNIPPQNPVFVGTTLTNYHYFFDLLIAKSGQIFSIDNQDLLFRFFPLFIAVLIGLLTYKLVTKITKNVWAGIFSTFFVYFGGSFGWIVNYFRDRSFGGETMFWAQQSISTLLNGPFAISLVLFLAGYCLFNQLMEEKRLNKLGLVSLIILWGSLIEFKAYGGVLILGALAIFTLERIIFKKDFKLLPVLLGCGFIATLVFLPNNLGGLSLFVYAPLWIVYTMIDFPDRLNWQRLSLAINSGVPYKTILGSILGVIIFLLGNLGTRLIGLFDLKAFLNFRLLFYIALLGIVSSLLFIQTGTNWNSIQFFYYSLFTFNIFAGITLASITSRMNKSVAIIVLGLIVLLTIPTTLSALIHYLPGRPPARLSPAEIEALNFLKKQSPGTVLSLTFDDKLRERYTTPIPLVAYTSTSYISAFSNHPSFLEDKINLDILGVDYKGRLNLQRDFVKIPDLSSKILKDHNISYVYSVKSQNFQEDENRMGIKKIFENDEVEIFRAN